MTKPHGASPQVPLSAHWKLLVYCLIMSRDGFTHLQRDWWRCFLKPLLGDMLSIDKLYNTAFDIELALMKHVRSNYSSRFLPKLETNHFVF